MKMKRSDVKMDVLKALKEVKREIGVRSSVYPKWIRDKKLQQITAATRLVALIEIKELLQKMEQKELSFDELKALIDSIQVKPKAQQSKMKFGSGNHSPKNPT